METKDLKIVPALEIVRFGEIDIVRTSMQKDEDETPWLPPSALM